jgi:sialate O-acetylesterase
MSPPSLPCLAAVTPSSMFGDDMVLQRDMPVPVWGGASPGERVTVTFAGHTVSATADQQGKWRGFLPALTASAEGRKMQIKGENTITFKDVLVGEVWVCSGQSNMQYGWGKQSLPMFNWGGDTELAALVADARKKLIRSYTVRTDVSFAPKENCRGQWSTDVSGSAVAFGFSYYLHEALDVPVAVIVACWGSSSIEGWMPLDMTEKLPHFNQRRHFMRSSSLSSFIRSATHAY